MKDDPREHCSSIILLVRKEHISSLPCDIMSSSSFSSILIPIPTATMGCRVTQMTLLFKPPNQNLGINRSRGRSFIQQQQQLQLNHQRLNSVTRPLRCSSSSSSDDATIVLHVGGMMCEGCAANVKRILESRPQVSSATVNLASETALVSPSAPNWEKQLGEELAHHLTTCGFTSTLQGQEDS